MNKPKTKKYIIIIAITLFLISIAITLNAKTTLAHNNSTTNQQWKDKAMTYKEQRDIWKQKYENVDTLFGIKNKHALFAIATTPFIGFLVLTLVFDGTKPIKGFFGEILAIKEKKLKKTKNNPSKYKEKSLDLIETCLRHDVCPNCGEKKAHNIDLEELEWRCDKCETK